MELRTLPIHAYQIDFTKPKNTLVLFGRANADFEKSMRILKRNDLEPLTCREALVNISQDPKLMDQLKGKWFYIKNSPEDHKLINNYFFNKRGKMTHGERETEKNVYAWFGENPLTIIINNDEDAKESGRRFTIDAGLPKNYVAPVVLGIKPRSEIIVPDMELLAAAVACKSGQDAVKKTFRN
jgi:hypothetical protein